MPRELLPTAAERYSIHSRRLFRISARARQRIEISLRAGLLRKIGVPAYHEREGVGLSDDGIRTAISLLQLTALSGDVQIRRHAEAVRRCNRDVFPVYRPLAF